MRITLMIEQISCGCSTILLLGGSRYSSSEIFIGNLRILRGTSRNITRAWNRSAETSPGIQFIKVD